MHDIADMGQRRAELSAGMEGLEIHGGKTARLEKRYGQRIAVLGLPAHDLLKTPEAMKIVGPQAFGYPELTFNPLQPQPIAA